MTDLLPEHVNRLDLRVHGASAILMMAPRSDDEAGDEEAQTLLSTALVHRGAHGLRFRRLMCFDPQLENSYRVLFPITAPDFLHGAGALFLESLSFEYQMLGHFGSVPRVVAWDGTSMLASFTEFPHNGGTVQLSLNEIKRFRKALAVGLILHTPVTQAVGVAVTYLGVRLASSTSIAPEPGDVVRG